MERKMINQKIEMTKFSTLQEWLDIQHQEYLNEWKNVGTLYHSTEYIVLANILYHDCLIAKIGKYPLKRPGKESISSIIWFSRNKRFGSNFRKTSSDKSHIRFVVDGSKLSNNYEILPFRNTDFYNDNRNTIEKFINNFGLNRNDIDEQAEVIFDNDVKYFIYNYVQKIEMYFDIKYFIYDFLLPLITIRDVGFKRKSELNELITSTFNHSNETFEKTIHIILDNSYNLTKDVQKIISIINNFYRLNIKPQNIMKIEVL